MEKIMQLSGESIFSSLAENLPNMVFINQGGRVIYANSLCTKVMGYTKEEFYSEDFDFRSLIAEESKETIKKAYKAHSQGKDVKPYQYKLVTKKGKQLDAIITTKLIQINGRPAILGVITDVTDQVEAQRRLREAQARYKSLIDNIQDGVFIIKDQKMDFVNEALARMIGYTPGEMIGKRFSRFIAPEDAKMIQERYSKRKKGEEVPREYEFRILHKDRKTRVIVNMNVGLANFGQEALTIGTVKDVTERVDAEKERQKLQKQLEQYTTRLETKIKRYEKIGLTENEKKVLYGLSSDPDSHDTGISERLGIKRSTTTAIRNRLLKGKYYSAQYIPKIVLQRGLLSVIYGRFRKDASSQSMKKAYDADNVVFYQTADERYMAFMLSQDLLEFHSIFDPILNSGMKFRLYEGYPEIVHFSLPITVMENFLDFTDVLNTTFNLGYPQAKSKVKIASENNLKKTQKNILLDLMKNPDVQSKQLAKKYRVTQATISNIKRDLNQRDILEKRILPSLSKLDFEIAAMAHYRFIPGTSDNDKRIDSRNAIVSLHDNHHKIEMYAFREYRTYKREIARIKERLQHRKILLSEPKVIEINLNRNRLSTPRFKAYTELFLSSS